MAQNNLNKQFNIPSWVKGDTIADETNSVMKRFKDRNGTIDKKTMESILENIAKKQEFVKMQEAMKTQSQQIPDQMDGQVPEGMEEYMQQEQPQQEQQFAEGGVAPPVNPIPVQQAGVNAIPNAGVDPTMNVTKPLGIDVGNATGGAGGDIGAIVGLAESAIGSTISGMSNIFGKPNVDMSGQQHIEKTSAGKKFSESLSKDGILAFNPISMAGNIIGARKENKAANLANFRNVGAQSAGMRQGDFAYGGRVKMQHGGIHPTTELMDKSYFANRDNEQNLPNTAVKGFKPNPFTKQLYGTQQPNINQGLNDAASLKGAMYDSSKFGSPEHLQNLSDRMQLGAKDFIGGAADTVRTTVGKGLDWLTKNAAKIGQFAPVASNLLELKNLKKTPTDRGSRLDSTYKPHITDEARNINLLNDRNTERALTESSGGDTGALRSSLLGSQINKLKGLSSIRAGQDAKDAAESQKAQQFDRQKDMTNIELDRDYQDRLSKDTAAYETTKSNLKRALFEDVGKISKEHMDKKTVEKMFGYKHNGEYYVDAKGNKVDDTTVFTAVTDFINKGKKKKDGDSSIST